MKYWNHRMNRMTEYIPGEQPDNIEEYIKLNTNENPFAPSQTVLSAIKNAANEELRRYPSSDSRSLRMAFAEKNNLQYENVFVGNGSDEIFTLIFRGFIEPDGLASFPYPSYSLYYTMAEANGIKYDKVNLNDEFDINFEDFLVKDYDLVIIANPNNPTGKSVDVEKIQDFLMNFKGLLVVDEAYVDFFGETAINLVSSFDNIIVTRSFSKSYSLAGLRVGIAIAHKDIIRGFLKLKDSYNVDRIAEAGAIAALLDEKGFKYNIEMLKNNKEYIENILIDLGFSIVPSKANYVFVKHAKMKSKDIYEKLKRKKILVRYMEGAIQSDYLRISVGSMMEIKTLIKELYSILEA
ncbi:MAG: histidinol-phosphate transaminase [Spirochaetota bacterium]|nr:histidinol-phosphate transaminase [Spirochaetota bacterium]